MSHLLGTIIFEHERDSFKNVQKFEISEVPDNSQGIYVRYEGAQVNDELAGTSNIVKNVKDPCITRSKIWAFLES